jgi:hypothetical protein
LTGLPAGGAVADAPTFSTEFACTGASAAGVSGLIGNPALVVVIETDPTVTTLVTTAVVAP